jgi:hypothetical protein
MGNVILLPVEVIARTASHLTPCRKTGKPHQGLSRGGDPMPLPLQNARKPLLPRKLLVRTSRGREFSRSKG